MNHDDEWLAQEQALHRERTMHARDDQDNAQVRSYRVVVRALKQPPPDLLPGNFAERVATLAEREAIAPSRLEDGLLAAFMTALLAGLIALILIDGQNWLHAVVGIHLFANPWVCALLGCLAISQGIAWWRPAGPRRYRPEA